MLTPLYFTRSPDNFYTQYIKLAWMQTGQESTIMFIFVYKIYTKSKDGRLPFLTGEVLRPVIKGKYNVITRYHNMPPKIYKYTTTIEEAITIYAEHIAQFWVPYVTLKEIINQC